MEHQIENIINIDRFQQLMTKYTNSINLATAIIKTDGEILVASGWQEICTNFHRVNSETCKKCIESDVALANELSKGQKFNMYKCLNGMVDVAVPIYIDKQHVANLFTGQFLMENPDIELFKTQAKNYNFDEKKYLKALSKVSVISDEEVKKIIDFLLELSMILGESGLTQLKLQNLTENQEDIIKKRTHELEVSQQATLKMMEKEEEARKIAENANIRLKEIMEDLKRSNEELEQFAYVASHDLQEPLRMVSSFTQLLANKYRGKIDSKADTYINYAVDGANRMQSLINNLLEFSRISTRGKDFELVNTNEVLKMAKNNLISQIKVNNAIVTNDELPIVFADKEQLSRVFQNLMANAIKFKGNSNPVIHISAERKDGNWQFKFSDNGIGIDEKYSNKIFVIFQRLHSRKEYEGNGIGLSICKRIINRHYGDIWFESKINQGTTFYFTLPEKT